MFLALEGTLRFKDAKRFFVNREWSGDISEMKLPL